MLYRIGGIEFLIEAVKHGSMLSRERACQAIGLLGVTSRGKCMLVEFDFVPETDTIVKRYGEQSTKVVAGNALGIDVMADVDHFRIVAKSGAVTAYTLIFFADQIPWEEKLQKMCFVSYPWKKISQMI